MDIIGKGRILGIASIVAVVASIVLMFTPGLNIGIDFESGTVITYRFDGEDPGVAEIRAAISDAGHPEVVVQGQGEGEYLVRLSELDQDEKPDIDQAVQSAVGQAPVTLDTTTVGRSVASDTVKNSIIAVAVASIGIMIYIVYAFRSVPKAYRYAIAAVVALGHDVAVTIGVFAVLGVVIGAEVNAAFIVGILTVIGYSVNDTIVIFDRLRENTIQAPNRPFRNTVNLSINETLARSLGTMITTATVILAMVLFGGETLRDFLLVLLIGVLVGTYSSIFVASNLLVAWQDGALGRILSMPMRRGDAGSEPA